MANIITSFSFTFGEPPRQAGIFASIPGRTAGPVRLVILEPFPFRLNRNGALDSWFDAFSRREPVSTSLENALDWLKLL
jgi:hypothetical protein